MVPRPDPTPESLQQSLAVIFDQVQTSLANHKKNCVALYKIHLKVSTVVADKKSKSKNRPDQSLFSAAFLDMVSRVVAVKKGPATVDRIIKFVAQYVLFVNEKALEEKTKQQPGTATDSISLGSSEDDETLASVFVSSILQWLIQGFVAKNKIVRYQTIHLVAEMILHLGEIDEDSYIALRENLIERSTCDKEPTVRAQAVFALARLVLSEDPAELEDGEKSILSVLLDVMSHDPSAEVRRAALIHLPLAADTLDAVLARTRDVDPLTRKLVYSTFFSPRLAHPRHLTIDQRERLVQTGLGDREPAVRLAAGKMLASWFDLVCAGDEPPSDLPWTGDDGGIMHALIAFLTLFDVVGPGEAIAVDAVLAVSAARPGLFDALVFGEDTYWGNLTPESAVLARVFVERPELTEDRLERAGLPVVTAFAFHMQEAYNQLLSAIEDAEVAMALNGGGEDVDDADANEVAEEEVAKREVVLGELLRMAVKLDYMDEIGRRKVYTVTRDMLAHPQLPPGLIARCLDVLKEILPTERELIRVVVEIVMDLRESESEESEPDMNDQDTTQSDVTLNRRERSMRRPQARADMTPEEAARADLTDLRCLALCNSMLERVHENFQDNSTLEGILVDLIIPAVMRKELSLREKGLVGLGLCCLLSKSIAVKSLQLFLSQTQSGPEELKTLALQALFDLMVLYGQELWTRSEDGEKVLTFLTDTLDAELDAEGSPRMQAILCIGLAKLLLAGLVANPKILQSLLLAYVNPCTASNAEVRQCLAYFFSVYCYSSVENQGRLQAIFMPAFDEVTRMHDGLEEGQAMITPKQFGLLIVDWTDSRKVAEGATPAQPRHVHADLAVDILLALYDSDRRGEDQEVLCTLFAQLYMEGQLAPNVLVKLSVLLEHVQRQCPFDDAALDKAVGRFKTRVADTFAEGLAKVDYAEYRTQEMREVYDYIGIDVPEYPDEPEKRRRSRTPESPIPKKSKKRGQAQPSHAGDEGLGSEGEGSKRADRPDVDGDDMSDEEVMLTSPIPPKALSPSRESTDDSDASAPPPSPLPYQKKGKQKAQAKNLRLKPTPPLPPPKDNSPDSEDVDDDDDDMRPPSPAPPPKANAASKNKVPARRSRSKLKPPPAPQLEDIELDSEGDLQPSSPPKAIASKSKATARNSRLKPREDNLSGSENDDMRPTSPIAPPKTRAGKSRPPTKDSRLNPPPVPPRQEIQDKEPKPARPTRQSRVKPVPPPAKEDTDPQSDAENNALPVIPSTPPAKGRKRVRTPGAKQSLPSPADTKRRRSAAPTRQSRRAPPTRATRSAATEEPRESDDDDFGGYSES